VEKNPFPVHAKRCGAADPGPKDRCQGPHFVRVGPGSLPPYRNTLKAEPIFLHKTPNRWYVDFAKTHNLKLRTHDFYNPDLFFEDGTWVEITLSENSAYKKLLRYGHQADQVAVYWLDEDTGLHKDTCRAVRFPNARIASLERLSPRLQTVAGGPELIEKLMLLKGLKGTIL
jgi:hypothetical protein